MLNVVRKQEEEFEEEEDLLGPCPEPAEWMGFEAKCEWMRSAPDLWKKGRLVGGNIALLENFCIAIGMIRECEAMMQEDGKIVGGKFHPAHKMMIDAMTQARSIASELRFARDGAPEETRTKANGWDERLLA